MSRAPFSLRDWFDDRGARLLRDPSSAMARVFDVMTIAFVIAFHRILGKRFLCAPFGFDEHYFVWEGFSVNKGMVPYRDFFEFKPPMVILVNSLGQKIFGLEHLAYRQIFSLLSLAGFLSLTIALLSRATNRWLIAALMALMINHYFDGALHDSTVNNAESVGLDFFMIGCGILLLETRWERTQQVLGGAVLALGPLSKEPLAFATLAAWLCILCLYRYESVPGRAHRHFALFTIAGVVVVLTTWIVYMLATHSLGSYVAQTKMSFAYAKNYAYQLGWFPKSSTDGELAEAWKRLHKTYVNAEHLAVFVPLFVAALALRSGPRILAGVAALACAVGGVYAVTIGHAYAGHYYIMAMTGTFFFAVVGALTLDVHSKRGRGPLRRWVGFSAAAVALVTLWPRFSEEREKYATYQPAAPPVNMAEVALVQSLSSPGDRIWTLGEPLLYVYSGRLNAVRWGGTYDELIDYFPGKTDEEKLAGERAALVRNRPKLVVFGEDPIPGYGRKQRYIKALVMPFLTEYGYTKVHDKVYARP